MASEDPFGFEFAVSPPGLDGTPDVGFLSSDLTAPSAFPPNEPLQLRRACLRVDTDYGIVVDPQPHVDSLVTKQPGTEGFVADWPHQTISRNVSMTKQYAVGVSDLDFLGCEHFLVGLGTPQFLNQNSAINESNGPAQHCLQIPTVWPQAYIDILNEIDGFGQRPDDVPSPLGLWRAYWEFYGEDWGVSPLFTQSDILPSMLVAQQRASFVLVRSFARASSDPNQPATVERPCALDGAIQINNFFNGYKDEVPTDVDGDVCFNGTHETQQEDAGFPAIYNLSDTAANIGGGVSSVSKLRDPVVTPQLYLYFSTRKIKVLGAYRFAFSNENSSDGTDGLTDPYHGGTTISDSDFAEDGRTRCIAQLHVPFHSDLGVTPNFNFFSAVDSQSYGVAGTQFGISQTTVNNGVLQVASHADIVGAQDPNDPLPFDPNIHLMGDGWIDNSDQNSIDIQIVLTALSAISPWSGQVRVEDFDAPEGFDVIGNFTAPILNQPLIRITSNTMLDCGWVTNDSGGVVVGAGGPCGYQKGSVEVDTTTTCQARTERFNGQTIVFGDIPGVGPTGPNQPGPEPAPPGGPISPDLPCEDELAGSTCRFSLSVIDDSPATRANIPIIINEVGVFNVIQDQDGQRELEATVPPGTYTGVIGGSSQGFAECETNTLGIFDTAGLFPFDVENPDDLPPPLFSLRFRNLIPANIGPINTPFDLIHLFQIEMSVGSFNMSLTANLANFLRPSGLIAPPSELVSGSSVNTVVASSFLFQSSAVNNETVTDANAGSGDMSVQSGILHSGQCGGRTVFISALATLAVNFSGSGGDFTNWLFNVGARFSVDFSELYQAVSQAEEPL